MSVSKAQQASNAKYDAAHMQFISVKWKLDEAESLTAYCRENGLSRNGFVRAAVIRAIVAGDKRDDPYSE